MKNQGITCIYLIHMGFSLGARPEHDFCEQVKISGALAITFFVPESLTVEGDWRRFT